MKKTLNFYSIIALGTAFALSLAFSPSITKAEQLAADVDTGAVGHVEQNFVSNGLPNPSAMDDEAGQNVGQPQADANVASPSNPPFVSNNLPNPSAVNNNPDNNPAPSTEEVVAPKKKRRSGGGHTSIVKKPAAAALASAPIAPATVAVNPTPVVKPTVASTPVKPVVAAAPATDNNQVAVAPTAPATTDTVKDNGSNLAASASQSFGSRFVNFFIKLWTCAFGNECR